MLAISASLRVVRRSGCWERVNGRLGSQERWWLPFPAVHVGGLVRNAFVDCISEIYQQAVIGTRGLPLDGCEWSRREYGTCMNAWRRCKDAENGQEKAASHAAD